MAALAAYFQFLDTFDDLLKDEFASHSVYEKDDKFFIVIPPSSAEAGPFASRYAAFRHLWMMIEDCRESTGGSTTIATKVDRKQPTVDATQKAVRFERTSMPVGKEFMFVTDKLGSPVWVKMVGSCTQRVVYAVFAHEDGTRFLVHDNCHDSITLKRQLTIRCCQQRMKESGRLKRVPSVSHDCRCTGCRKRQRDSDRFCAKCGKQRHPCE
jgi:hypothetical protein